MTRPRVAVRAILMRDDRLCLVNAWRNAKGGVYCAPGGGVELHQSLPDSLRREVHEETGMRIDVGAPCLVNEFHDPGGDYHQVEVFFRCRVLTPQPDEWTDPEGVVSEIHWVTRAQLGAMRVRPRALAAVAWGDAGAPTYDPLEPILT